MAGFHRLRNSKNTTKISWKTKRTSKISSWKTEFWKVQGNIQIRFCQQDRAEKLRGVELTTKLKIRGPSIRHRDIISICWKIIRRAGSILRPKSSTRRILWVVCPDNRSISYRLIRIEIWCWNQPMTSWNLSEEEITRPKIRISSKYSYRPRFLENRVSWSPIQSSLTQNQEKRPKICWKSWIVILRLRILNLKYRNIWRRW